MSGTGASQLGELLVSQRRSSDESQFAFMRIMAGYTALADDVLLTRPYLPFLEAAADQWAIGVKKVGETTYMTAQREVDAQTDLGPKKTEQFEDGHLTVAVQPPKIIMLARTAFRSPDLSKLFAFEAGIQRQRPTGIFGPMEDEIRHPLDLTKYQRNILELAAQGTNVIARELGVKNTVVTNRLTEARSRNAIPTRQQLFTNAFYEGIVARDTLPLPLGAELSDAEWAILRRHALSRPYDVAKLTTIGEVALHETWESIHTKLGTHIQAEALFVALRDKMLDDVPPQQPKS